MQRLFFHNKFDKNSIAAMALYPDATVYDAFIREFEPPEGIRLVYLPYLVDKELELITAGPYTAGTILIQFQCKDYQGNNLETGPVFTVAIDGTEYQEEATNGLVEIELTVESAATISISIVADGSGFMPWQGVIEVVEASS